MFLIQHLSFWWWVDFVLLVSLPWMRNNPKLAHVITIQISVVQINHQHAHSDIGMFILPPGLLSSNVWEVGIDSSASLSSLSSLVLLTLRKEHNQLVTNENFWVWFGDLEMEWSHPSKQSNAHASPPYWLKGLLCYWNSLVEEIVGRCIHINIVMQNS